MSESAFSLWLAQEIYKAATNSRRSECWIHYYGHFRTVTVTFRPAKFQRDGFRRVRWFTVS